jgi:ABC-2 type transport system permease protein
VTEQTTTRAATTTAGHAAPALPSLGRTVAVRFGVELRSFLRGKEAVVFTLAFPPLLLVIFGAVFGRQQIEGGVSFAQYFVPGMIASGLVASSFQNLAISIPIERDSGSLKRLQATPMPPAAYFLGKVLLVAVISVVEIVLLMAIGVLFYDLDLPSDGGRWLTFAWVVALGVAACTLLGVAFSGFVRNGESAPAIVSPITIILQFISGVYFVFSQLPSWMQEIAAVFPLKWMTQGMRSVFLPDDYTSVEPAGTWEHGRIALVLAVWCVVGLGLALRFFRWRSREDG